MKSLPTEVEFFVQSQTQHVKASYKRFMLEFYKSEGYSEAMEPVLIRDEAKKKRKQLAFMLVAIGNAIEIEYELVLEGVK